MIRDVVVGAAGPQCLPPRTRCIEITDEWARRHDGLVATLGHDPNAKYPESLLVTLHAPEGDVLYRRYRFDLHGNVHHLRRVDQ